ncbi:hypothetical protein [Haladaptatus halobius]|uniref:hypothetical protein n=1 Tax=Haladaptatus halobius TaxID=2884875 RepID=UPI001D0B8C72|nr:hypothetical protein [Haladaptatus halobius]
MSGRFSRESSANERNRPEEYENATADCVRRPAVAGVTVVSLVTESAERVRIGDG